MSDQLLTPKEVASICGVTPRTVGDWRQKGEGPPYVKLSSRVVRYRREDVLAWIASHEEGTQK